MFPVIDFRNGRYQGQTKQQLPHGAGCFMDSNFMFCMGEWIGGELVGKAIIMYPSGRVFFGKIQYRDMEGLCSFQLVEDHVQLIFLRQNHKKQRDMQKMAALLPLLKIVLDIDNSNPQHGKVLSQYDYSTINEKQNMNAISKILKLDKNAQKLYSYRHFLSFFEEHFYKVYPNVFEFNIIGYKGKKQYFMGLKGEGLGIKIQPNQQLGLNMVKAGRVYLVRGMGYFTNEKVLKDIGLKMKDSSMKGVVYQQGVFSIPSTLISYQSSKRPINSFINFHSHMKRSLFYRDKVLQTGYLYDLQSFVFPFNENLRVIQTQRVAQQTIQTPNVLRAVQKQTSSQSKGSNPYNPMMQKQGRNPEYGLYVAKDDIYRSANKKRNIPEIALDQYKKSQYIDPNYRKIQPDDFGYTHIRQPYIPKEVLYDYPRNYLKQRPSYDYRQPYFPRRQKISPNRNADPYSPQYPTSLYPNRQKRSVQRQYNRYQNAPRYDSPSRYNNEDYPYNSSALWRVKNQY